MLARDFFANCYFIFQLLAGPVNSSVEMENALMATKFVMENMIALMLLTREIAVGLKILKKIFLYFWPIYGLCTLTENSRALLG